MYTLLIVEDEAPIREGLAATIPWEKLGFQVTGQASNGREALQEFQRYPADVILTDIRMPGMDGVELLKEVRKRSERTKVIFISSYAEFAYAQQAVEYKAFSYIMKFDLFDKLEPTFTSLREHMDAERIARKENSDNQHYVNNQTLLRVLRQGDTFGLKLPERYCFQVMAVRPRVPFPVETLARIQKEQGLACCQNGEELYFLFCHAEESLTEELRKDCYSLLARERPGEPLWAAAGCMVHGRDEIPVSYYGALKLLDCMQAGRVFDAPLPVYSEQDFPTLDISPRFSAGELARLLAFDTLQEFLKLVLEYLHFSLLDGSNFITDCRGHLLLAFGRAVESYGGASQEGYEGFSQKLSACDHLDELFQLVSDTAAEMSEQNAALAQGSLDMKQVLRYISNHFSGDIKLQDMAARFYVSAPYLSILFKKHTGMNFNEYLRQCRLQWAEHLLRTTELKIVEIARNVGYTDQKYFTGLFEEQYGCNPSAYRREKRDRPQR